MLYLNNQRVIENITIYGDDKKFNLFYPIPEQPRFRVDEKGRPVFKFLKYRFPIDREGGKKGGGFAAFDVEFTIPDGQMERVKAKLQEEVNTIAQRRNINPVPSVEIGNVRYSKGTSRIMISDDNSELVERILDAGKPSLFGKNIATYNAEFSPEGAAFFESALQGNGGFIGVMYELYHDAKLPPIKVTASFHASAFYKFVQEIDVEERACAEDDYKETLSEMMRRSESRRIELDAGSSQVDPKVVDQIRTWAQNSLDDAAERLMIESLPVEDAAEARKWYQENDIEDVRKEVVRSSVSNFTLRYKEESYVEVNINPQGIMPNITTIVDKEGNQIKWEDYAEEVDLNHPFFKQINTTVKVNAPFDKLPLHSVEVKLTYKGEPMDVIGSDVNGEFQFSDSESSARFASFIKDNDFKYNYSYQINYKGSAKTYQSEVFETDESVLTINVDDVGVLFVELLAGDLDFNQIAQAQISIEYEDSANGVDKISDQFIIDKDNLNHEFSNIIFTKWDKPYRYKVNYKMTDGKEISTDWIEESSPRLYINDPFSQTKNVGFRAAGDLENDISNIFLDAVYEDTENNYRLEKSIALSKSNPFFDWGIPVINSKINTITYGGQIAFKDGSIEDIPQQTSSSSTIIVGNTVEDKIEISVLADLLDFTNTVKIAHVQLQYVDEENNINERKALTFKAGAIDAQKWQLELKDKSKVEYTWKATYFMMDNSRKETEEQTTSDLTLFLELPQ